MKYTMTEDEFNEIYEISRPVPVVIIAGENLVANQYKRASKFWQTLADKYNFNVNTVKPCGNDMYSFEADPA